MNLLDGGDQAVALWFCQPPCNFIEQQQIGFVAKRPRHFQAFAIEQGQFTGLLIGFGEQAREVQNLKARILHLAQICPDQRPRQRRHFQKR